MCDASVIVLTFHQSKLSPCFHTKSHRRCRHRVSQASSCISLKNQKLRWIGDWPVASDSGVGAANYSLQTCLKFPRMLVDTAFSVYQMLMSSCLYSVTGSSSVNRANHKKMRLVSGEDRLYSPQGASLHFPLGPNRHSGNSGVSFVLFSSDHSWIRKSKIILWFCWNWI
jgi:hypothetical protein